MIIKSLRRIYQIHGAGYICRLQVLTLGDFHRSIVLSSEVAEGDMPISEVHSRRDAEGKVVRKAQFSEHSDMETVVAAILFARHERLHHIAILVSKPLCAYILKLQSLKVSAHNDAEMQRAQVAIRAVFHCPFLRMERLH